MKPTRHVVVTAACVIAVAALVAGVSTQPAVTHAATDLTAVRATAGSPPTGNPTHVLIPAPLTGTSSGSSPLAAGASPANPTSSPSSPSTGTTVILPPAPALHPAAQDAAAVAAAAAAAANVASHPSSGGSSNRSGSGGSSGGGAAAPAPGGSSYPERADIANAIYSAINSERAANGLPALGRSGQLNNSAHAHNVAMANTGQFSHQVTGEASLGARITAAGYHWTWAGENIAWGSYASVAFGLSLQSQMYNETPPDDGHRLNILSTSAHNVGVDVITDGSGKMWITCDFGS